MRHAAPSKAFCAIRAHKRHHGEQVICTSLNFFSKLVGELQSFVKGPATGMCQARPPPESEWFITKVLELRIISNSCKCTSICSNRTAISRQEIEDRIFTLCPSS